MFDLASELSTKHYVFQANEKCLLVDGVRQELVFHVSNDHMAWLSIRSYGTNDLTPREIEQRPLPGVDPSWGLQISRRGTDYMIFAEYWAGDANPFPFIMLSRAEEAKPKMLRFANVENVPLAIIANPFSLKSSQKVAALENPTKTFETAAWFYDDNISLLLDEEGEVLSEIPFPENSTIRVGWLDPQNFLVFDRTMLPGSPTNVRDFKHARMCTVACPNSTYVDVDLMNDGRVVWVDESQILILLWNSDALQFSLLRRVSLPEIVTFSMVSSRLAIVGGVLDPNFRVLDPNFRRKLACLELETGDFKEAMPTSFSVFRDLGLDVKRTHSSQRSEVGFRILHDGLKSRSVIVRYEPHHPPLALLAASAFANVIRQSLPDESIRSAFAAAVSSWPRAVGNPSDFLLRNRLGENK